MQTDRRRRTRRRTPWGCAAAVAVAACVAVAAAAPEGRDGAVVEGGRLSHLCRAGLWVMGTGHVATGGLLMWLGC